MIYFDLQFFKGSSSSETVQKREAKSDQLKAMDDAVYSVMGGLLSRYGGYTMPDIQSYSGGTTTTTASSGNTYGTTGSSGKTYGTSGSSSSGGTPSVYVDSNGGRHYNGNSYSNKGSATSADGEGISNRNYSITPTAVTTTTQNVGGDSWAEGGYLDTAFDEADALASLANKNSADLLAKIPSYLDKSDSMLDAAQDFAVDTSEQALKFYDNSDWYLDQHKDLLSNGTNTGLQNALSEVNKSVQTALNESVGSNLSDWAARGIMNSSTANKGLQTIEGEAADATAANYKDIYDTMLSQYLGGAEQSKGLAEAVIDTQNNTVNNYATIAQGYRDQYDSGLSGLETFAELPTQYYENALAPLMPAYNFWNQSTQNWLANDQDTVVTSESK